MDGDKLGAECDFTGVAVRAVAGFCVVDEWAGGLALAAGGGSGFAASAAVKRFLHFAQVADLPMALSGTLYLA
jgi:hypothetical protein